MPEDWGGDVPMVKVTKMKPWNFMIFSRKKKKTGEFCFPRAKVFTGHYITDKCS